jgi:hypothetical protein
LLDLGPAPRIGAEQRRRGVQLLEVAADRHRLAQGPPVGQLEHRHQPQRVLVEKRRRHVGVGGDRHLDQLDLIEEALLGQEHADAAGVGRAEVVVEAHHGGTLRSGMRRITALVPRATIGLDLQTTDVVSLRSLS